MQYGTHSGKLLDAMAGLARCQAYNIVKWSEINALISSRLISLGKCPGVRPIAIVEEPRQIICKVMAIATGGDIEELCGVHQLCSSSTGWS